MATEYVVGDKIDTPIGIGSFVIDNPTQPALAHLYRVHVIHYGVENIEDGGFTVVRADQVEARSVEVKVVPDPLPNEL